jgi:hypothetical protein
MSKFPTLPPSGSVGVQDALTPPSSTLAPSVNATKAAVDNLQAQIDAGGAGVPAANSIANTQLVDVPTGTVKARVSAGTGDPEDVALATFKAALGLTKADVGLPAVENLAPADYPVSTAQAAALALKSDVGHTHDPAAVTGLAEFIRDTIAAALVPGANVTITVDDEADTITIASTGGGGGGGLGDGNYGDVTVSGSGAIITINSAAVTLTKMANLATGTVIGRTTAGTGVPEALTFAQVKTALGLVKADVGLGSVDNTSDADKPVSTAQQAALDGKAPVSHGHVEATISNSGFMTTAHVIKLNGVQSGATANSSDATLLNRANHTGSQAISTVTGLQAALDAKASADSPNFTGPMTSTGTSITTPFAMGAGNAIDVTRGLNTKSIIVDTTLTFSATPAANTWFTLHLINTSSSARLITIPGSFSVGRQTTVTSLTIPANGQIILGWYFTGSVYVLSGDSGARNNLSATTAPGASNDNTQGYAVGSMWVDAVANRVYFCTNASTGSAVWWGGSAGGGSWGSITGTLSDQTDLQTALNAKAGLIPVIEVVSGTSRTLTAADNGKILVFTNTGAISVALGTGFSGNGCTLAWNDSAGVITVNLTDVTVNGSSSALVLSNARGSLSLIPSGTNAFLAIGSIGELMAADISDSTANGRAILTAGDYAAMRSLLSLVIGSDVAAQSHVGSGGAAHANATTSVAGFLSAADKTKLDGLPAQGTTREITGAATLGAADVNVTVRFNSGSAAALTVPSDSTLGVTPGKATLAVFIQGAGVPTFTGSGATILGSPRSGLAQNDTILLNHTGIANTWSYA